MGGLSIDFTLIVQSFNFGIAYIAIRILLLKPAVAAIRKNESIKRTLNYQIEKATLSNSSQQDHLDEQWRLYRLQVKEKVPAFTESTFPLPCPQKILVEHKRDKAVAESTVTSIAKILVERMRHVRP